MCFSYVLLCSATKKQFLFFRFNNSNTSQNSQILSFFILSAIFSFFQEIQKPNQISIVSIPFLHLSFYLR
ncbi:hypothetical protein LEP1GSC103_3753 [Leptospira borgpetersenii serovar Javanica str. UI 09931]|uniref:Uncharacterized protein n=3 Tax=Leptospira borgpetersenii TaxID=174 RepID=M3H1T0_LEPBO|nr:hypothetical protein C4Q31_08685 [Leptospira borgpetersenii serovar Ceylonica]EKP15282.1 hypothetical protein LEP1GSC128_1984 [Leptospira borgpetersenii str. 200801926]EMG01024.1 hypothetical protein LEP1GSC123_3630 [Leptospira borgpetersenii str. 200701203]EMK09433.1 hypothetical protein LEP1GSC066_1432 [Leptospira sp. serovar Kenya str. Sh9]EMN58419.1 hypothetical protein LEP1GSC090_3123 [Leptospira borgpetersenii serovar Javanica str. MK146]ENO62665.1 hypothetical protein LEP1GSC191_0495